MEQILLAYGLPKETVAAITILYRNTNVNIRSPDEDTEYFDIVAGVLQGDTQAPYLSIICLDYVLKTSIDKIRENGFELAKKRSRRYPAKTITDADYADDIAILANTTKPKRYCIVWNEPPQALAYMSMHTKLNICAIIKQATFSHGRRNLSETGRQIHLPRKQCLINRKRHRHTANEGTDSYR